MALAAGALTVIGGLNVASAGTLVAEGHKVASVKGGESVLADGDGGFFHPGWYVGIGAGRTELEPEGGTSGWQVPDTESDGTRLFIGRHFKPRWRAELAISDLGSVGLNNTNPAINAAVPDAAIDYSSISLHLDWLLRPVNNPFNAFLRAGVSSIDNSVSDDAILYDRDDDVAVSYGAGVQWRGKGRWMAQLTYEHIAEDAQWLGLTVGAYLGKSLGATSASGAMAGVAGADTATVETGESAEPAPVAARQVDQCRVVKRAVPGIEFASGSAEFDASSENLLVQVAAALARAPDILVEVVGHTDSQGDAAYNQNLSEQRAKTVRDFLAAQPGVMTQISWRGAGEAEPLVANTTADGRMQNRRIELVFDNRLVCQN